LLGWRQIIVGVVPSVVKKNEAWLVAAKAKEVAKVVAESGDRKTRQKNGFFSTLASDFSP
jgi:hypothetical protein